MSLESLGTISEYQGPAGPAAGQNSNPNGRAELELNDFLHHVWGHNQSPDDMEVKWGNVYPVIHDPRKSFPSSRSMLNT